MSLRGQAQGVLGNLPATDRENYEKLVKTLSERFSPESQTELYRAQLKEREWNHGDNVAEFAQRILRLITLSYPRADTALVDSLAMGYFIDAISDAEMRLKIKQTRPKDLNEAIKVAIELEAFDRAERRRKGLKYARGSNNTDEQKETFDLRKLTDLVQQEIKKASSSKESSKWGLQEKGKKRRTCFICDDKNHLARSCPKQKCYICKGLGHRAFDCPKNYRNKKPKRVAPKETYTTRKEKQTKRAGINFEHDIGLIDTGMYCSGVLQGLGINALIDSGATATMISNTVYQKLPHLKKPVLEPMESRMIASNGEDVITICVGEFTFSFSGKQFQLPAVYANITTGVILDLDFMQKYNCDISMKECTVTTEEVVIKCFMKGKMGCYRITARETITIPSEHEVVIPGKVADRGVFF